MNKNHIRIFPAIVAGILLSLSCTNIVFAHCDTMNGPVIIDAKKALEKGDVTKVLKWIKKENEDIIKEAFKKTLTVRILNNEAKELADNYFFESLVRIHRAGEGAPYNGLKTQPVEKIIELSDKALETGKVDELINKISGHVSKEINEKFEKVLKAKKHADENVETGREYVKAYVQYVHFIEGIHNAVMSKGQHQEEEKVKE